MFGATILRENVGDCALSFCNTLVD